MYLLDLVVTTTTVIAVAVAAFSDFTRGSFAMAMSARVGVPPSWFPVLGTLKAAGATGLVLGVSDVPFIGVAAATGLVLFFLGGIVVHLRAHEHRQIFITLGYLALAVASLAFAAAR
jgi:hypothetical protein